jgi:hypothetical protein
MTRGAHLRGELAPSFEVGLGVRSRRRRLGGGKGWPEEQGQQQQTIHR